MRQRLNLRWGVMPFLLDFSVNPEENVQRTFKLLQARGFVKESDLVVVVSDIRTTSDEAKDQGPNNIVRSVQLRRVQ